MVYGVLVADFCCAAQRPGWAARNGAPFWCMEFQRGNSYVGRPKGRGRVLGAGGPECKSHGRLVRNLVRFFPED